MNTLTDKDIYDSIELLTEEDVRSILREILQQIRDEKFSNPAPKEVYIPYKLWRILETYKGRRV